MTAPTPDVAGLVAEIRRLTNLADGKTDQGDPDAETEACWVALRLALKLADALDSCRVVPSDAIVLPAKPLRDRVALDGPTLRSIAQNTIDHHEGMTDDEMVIWLMRLVADAVDAAAEPQKPPQEKLGCNPTANTYEELSDKTGPCDDFDSRGFITNDCQNCHHLMAEHAEFAPAAAVQDAATDEEDGTLDMSAVRCMSASDVNRMVATGRTARQSEEAAALAAELAAVRSDRDRYKDAAQQALDKVAALLRQERADPVWLTLHGIEVSLGAALSGSQQGETS